MTDALGNEIIIGNAYGFARCDNGINTIKLGVAESETKTGLCSLKINNAFTSAYMDQPIKNERQHYEKVKVKPFMLFPI